MNSGTEQIFLLNAAPNQPISSAPTQMMSAIVPPPISTPVNLDSINVEDFSRVCRICATITELVMPILSGEGLQNNLGRIIRKYLPITVREKDELPVVICYQCASTLLAWHELVKCCIETDLALHSKISDDKRAKAEAAQSALVEDGPLTKFIPMIFPPATPYYRLFASSHPVANANNKKHLAVNHFNRLMHCKEPNNLVDRREFRQHLSFHASQDYRRQKAQNNIQARTTAPTIAPTAAPTNIVPKCSPKIDSPSPKPIIKTKEGNTSVPVKINSPVPVKINNPVPVKINSPVPVKINNPVPVKINTPVPVTNAPVPVKMNTPEPVKMNTPEPVKINTPVPVKINSPVPVKMKTPAPVKINTPAPVKITTPAPVKMNTPAPVKITTPAPVKINTPAPVKMNTPVTVKINTPVSSTIDKTSVQENEFSDHSDTEGFGLLPESVFDAIEDSQDGQQLTQPAGTTSHAPETERPKDESIKSDASQNNNLTNPTISSENNNNMNNCSVVIEPMKIESNNNMNKCSVVIEPMKIENCAQRNIATRKRSAMNILVPPENKSLPKTAKVNSKQSTDEKGKKNQKTRKCPFCPKEYRASSSYFYHLKHSHEGAKEHECEVCGRKLYSKSSLTQHMTLHRSYYDYECSQCEKQFKSKAGLYIHEQTHTGLKSFSCNHCDTSFRWRTHLIRHMARHSAERAHVCGACGRGFTVRCDLLRHARTHSKGNFACDKCGRKFAQLRYLKVHTTKQHARHGRSLTK